MNKIQTYALFYNLIIYLIMIFPIFIILLKKDFTNSFKKLVSCFIYITILENSLHTRALENKSYSISLTAPLSWTAGYNVVIRNNLISSVNSPHYKCYTGKISSAALKKDSSKQATLRFTHTVLGISTRGGVRTNIADNKLKVSRL